MRLSDISVQRPVLAALIVAFGLLALTRLPLQEYPTIDPPVVGIDTRYPGASASVVETRITQVLEDRIAGARGNLPDEAEPPEVQKADAGADVVLWLALSGTGSWYRWPTTCWPVAPARPARWLAAWTARWGITRRHTDSGRVPAHSTPGPIHRKGLWATSQRWPSGSAK
ncbi:hypothetical protein FHR97_000223 [Halomonas stenophila]|uniref:Uncharacterized protein n=1 Tax=Halomonas stenophila TaxID=795312 RepID=A0A7W5HJY6_9GAMM|nr:hypothetical protein [Halomonas stenophila]